MSENCVFGPFGQFSDIFRTFFRHFSDISSTFPFSGLSNDLPVTTLVPIPVLRSVKILVILKPAGQTLEINDSNPIQGKFRPQTPRSTPTKSTINIASAKLGVVCIFLFLRFRQFAHQPPPTNTTRWGRSSVGMAYCSRSPIMWKLQTNKGLRRFEYAKNAKRRKCNWLALLWLALGLGSQRSPNSAEAQKGLKWPKSDSQGPTPYWPPSESKVTQKWLKHGVRSQWHFWVTLGSVCPSHFWVTFGSL